MKRYGVILITILLLLQETLAGSARAEWDTTFMPTFSAGMEYDSNIFFTPSREESDLNYQGTLLLPFTASSPDTHLGLSYRTTRFQYLSKTSADYGNHFVNFDVDHSLTPRLKFSLSDAYSTTKDSDRVLRSAAGEGETGILVDRVRRKANSVTGTLSYLLSRRFSINLSGYNMLYRYSLPIYYDTLTNGGNLSLTYVLDPKNTFSLSMGIYNSDYSRNDRQLTENAVFSFGTTFYALGFNSEFTRSRNTTASLGWTHRFSPTLNINFALGARKTRDRTDPLSLIAKTGRTVEIPNSLSLAPGTPVVFSVEGSSLLYSTFVTSSGKIILKDVALKTTEDTATNSGLVYTVGLEKTFVSSALSLTFSQDVSARAAFGGTTVRRNVSAHYNDRFSERLSTFYDLRYDRNEYESSLRNDIYKTLRGGIGLRYAMTRNLSSTLSWYHTVQKRELEGAKTSPRTDRDVATLVLTYVWPLVR